MPHDRVVLLIDMDCFYCQVEELANPELAGKPIAVVQYNQWQGGGIIAVNYPARDKGVTRHMRGKEAQELCPEIELVRVPNIRGKADLSKYREAGKRVAEVLQTFTPLLERASVDEAYLDVTELVKARIEEGKAVQAHDVKNSHAVGFDSVEDFIYEVYDGEFLTDRNLKLLVGGLVAEEIRHAVYEKTGYKCSAGIAHNKILAKLVCGLHKPNQQTILPQERIPELYEDLPVGKVRSLGGKFGESVVEKLNIRFMGELGKFSEQELMKIFDDKSAKFLYNIARGIDTEPVTPRLIAKSIGCSKKFPGKAALISEESIKHWVTELAEELSERLCKDQEENNRKGKQMVVGFTQKINKKDVSNSRSAPLNSYETERIAQDVCELIKKNCRKPDGTYHVIYLAMNVGKFEETKKGNGIADFFKQCEVKKAQANKSPATNYESDDSINGEIETNKVEKDTSSFFTKFINEAKCESPVERNFDTSMALQEIEEDNVESSVDFEALSNIPSTSSDNVMKDICPDCNKRIPLEEMASHNDYHFALKMVRDEADLYKQPKPEPVIVKKESPVKKGNKRKVSASSNCLKLTSFLTKKMDLDLDVPTEKCSECGKLIPVESFIDHADYHLAKRLHLELNATIKSATKPTPNTKVEVKRNNIKSKDKNIPSVAQFFKTN